MMPESSAERIAIVCGADAAWVRPLAAMVQSVLANHGSHRGIDLFVMAGRIAEEDRARLEASWVQQGARCHWLAIPEGQFAGAPLWGRMPVTTYYKLAVADVLPADVRRAIWLDSDLVVLADIARLWESDLQGRHVLAARDRIVPFIGSPFGIRHCAALGIDPAARYFNAGVMLMDVDMWRRDGIAGRALAYLRQYQRDVYFWDQEGLNAVLAGRWGELDERWNRNASVPGAWGRGTGAQDADGADEHHGAAPWILHYAGNVKPWMFPSRDHRRRLFFDYLDQTPWAGWRPEPSLAGKLFDLYEHSGLRRRVYPVERLAMRAARALSRRSVAGQGVPRREADRLA